MIGVQWPIHSLYNNHLRSHENSLLLLFLTTTTTIDRRRERERESPADSLTDKSNSLPIGQVLLRRNGSKVVRLFVAKK